MGTSEPNAAAKASDPALSLSPHAPPDTATLELLHAEARRALQDGVGSFAQLGRRSAVT
jgi:hypothetical protein